MLTLEQMIIRSSETLKSAMQRMTRNHRGVLFVCDENSHLVGVLSDGDIRRTLLEDTLLVSPVYNVMNTDPVTAQSSEEAAELLKKFGIVAVPVVDQQGCIREAAVEDQNDILILGQSVGADSSEVRTQTGAVAIIPARGGSKRIPRKNLALLAGQPLVNWTVQVARAAANVSHVVVSTDDPEIAETVRKAGASVPWLRPEDLSGDSTPSVDVLLHAIAWASENLTPKPEFGLLLEPTAPLRRAEHLDDALELLAVSDADCVMSVSEVPHVLNPEELLSIENGLVRSYLPYRTMDTRCLRGEQSPVYVQNGLVYAFRIASVLEHRSLYGKKVLPLVTSWEDFLDIDTPEDLRAAELRLSRV